MKLKFKSKPNPHYQPKNIWRKLAFFATTAGLLLAGVGLVNYLDFKVRSNDQAVLGLENTPVILQLNPGELEKRYESPVFKADYEFNALAPHWQETLAPGESRLLYIRVSEDNRTWTDWVELEMGGAVRDDDPTADRVFPENPLFIPGRYYQYRINLSRNALSDDSPQIRDFQFNYIDSTPSVLQEIVGKFTLNDSEVLAANGGPNVVSRAAWGSPDPNGTKLQKTDRYWPPTYAQTKQVFLHHTATSSNPSDPKAVMRALWDFHANTRRWGDIGYNYVVDQNGTIYEGRYGGDNVTAGHVKDYNRGSMGVAVMGCFQPDSSLCAELNRGNTTGPTTATLNGLATLLSWKTTSLELNPKSKQNFCDINNRNCKNLYTISAHRDALDTSCNGQLLYDKSAQIRQAVADKNAQKIWSHAARLTNFQTVNLSADASASITLSFKNTGTATWSNSTNRILLRTTASSSPFQTSQWIDAQTMAVLNEPSVAPGEIGTFTLPLKRFSGAYGDYTQTFRLVSEGNQAFSGHFGIEIEIYCSFGTASNPRPNGILIRNPRNGMIFRIENGTKRWISSPAVASSQRLSLGYARNVTQAELSLIPDGPLLKIAEGSLIKASGDTKIYIIDEAEGVYYKRHVASPAVIKKFDIGKTRSFILSPNQVNSYPSAPALFANSTVPDGIVVTSKATRKIFLTEAGTKRHITSLAVYLSHGYGARTTSVVEDQVLADIPIGPVFGLIRSGTLVTSDDTTKIFAIDGDGDGRNRRWVTSPRALTEAGFSWKRISTTSNRELASYTDAARIVCHQ